MTSNLTPAEHRQLRSLFHLVDRDQSGSITKQELASLLHTLNSPRTARHTHPASHPSHPQLALPATSEAIDALISECDINNDGEIDYTEFATVMSKRAGCKYTREEVLDAMRVFEVRGVSRGSGSGELSVELLERAVRMLDVGGVEVRGTGVGSSGGSGAGSGGGTSDGVIGVEEKRQQMLDMLAQLKVNYGGQFAYEQVGNKSHHPLPTRQLLVACLRLLVSQLCAAACG